MGVDYLLLFVFVVFVVLWSRFTVSPHEGTDLLDREGAIFVGIHRIEDFFVSSLKFLNETVPSPSLSMRAKIKRIAAPRPIILPPPIMPPRPIIPQSIIPPCPIIPRPS